MAAVSRNRREIIDLDSPFEPQREVERRSVKHSNGAGRGYENLAKLNNIIIKCQICKGSGAKAEMITCHACKAFIHLACLEGSQAKRNYCCDKCRAKQTPQPKIIRKIKKSQQKNQAKTKKSEKDKKREDCSRSLSKFQRKYPYFVGENMKIKFPIEDKLLFIYRDYFEFSESRPLPTRHPVIPSELLGDLLEIQNFIVSFGPEFERDYQGGYRKTMLYFVMVICLLLQNCDGPDSVFEQLLGAVLKIYLRDIFEKTKTENVKILNDNCFFILLGTFADSEELDAEMVSAVAPEIIRHLSTVPSMKDAFKSFVFPCELTLETKIRTLVSLIQGLSEVDGFHKMVSKKSERISELTKIKANYVNRLKRDEAEALCNKQKIKEIQGQVSQMEKKEENCEKQREQASGEQVRNSKEVEKAKKKTQKLSNEGKESEKVIKEMRNEILKITRIIPFTISEVLFLGNDRNNSQYYFYLREPHRVYTRYREFLLDDQPKYRIYESKSKIVELMKSLNQKGVHEKHLYEMINFLIKEEIIRNQTEEEECVASQNQMQMELMYIGCEEGFRQKVVRNILEMEEKYSNYLAIKNYRWACETKREEFKLTFPCLEDLHAVKEAIKTLQENFLFVEVLTEREREQLESNQENGDRGARDEAGRKELVCRRKPMRVWGINSERIRKFWLEYLETCIDYVGIWISVCIFKNFVKKYLDKKIEYIREQERRQEAERERERKRVASEKQEREEQEKHEKRLRNKQSTRKSGRYDEDSPDDPAPERPIPRRSSLRSSQRIKKLRRRPMTIVMCDLSQDSDDEAEQVLEEKDSSSGNQDECGICHEVGDVICCDTCPKVFHLKCLKLKEVPSGVWSCLQCLQRIANQRQTRSRARRSNNI